MDTRLIQELEIKSDSVLGVRVAIEFSNEYTKIIIGNRTLFFNSKTGKFDGTGVSV